MLFERSKAVLIKNQEKRVFHLKNGEGYAILEKGFQSREKTSKKRQKNHEKDLTSSCICDMMDVPLRRGLFFVRFFSGKTRKNGGKKLRLREVFGSMVSVMHDASNKLGGAEQ